jgi:glycosyltransferase involved in cell wall biosynthesis
VRILICTNVYPPRFVGGAELVAHELGRQMLAQGHEVAAFAGDLDGPGEHHAFSREIRDGIAVHRVNTVQQDYDPQHLNFLHPAVDRHFTALLRDFDPDVVHCHNLMGLSARLPILAAEHGAKVFVTLHDFWGFCLRNTLLREDGHTCDDYEACRICLPAGGDTPGGIMPLRLRKDLLSLAFDHVDGFVAPSAFIAQAYRRAGLASERITVIPNGMDLDRFAPLKRAASGPVRLLYVGYFGSHKGVDVLLQAVAMLDHVDVMLNMVGAGSQEAAYRARVAELGIENRVSWRGRMAPKDMPQVYAHADVVVLPSIWGENQPVCLMEAMACGLPVVASRIGGIPDIVEDEREGLLFDPGDPRALADAVESLALAPELRAAMGAKGRERLSTMSYQAQATNLLSLFAAPSYAMQRDRDLIAVTGDYVGQMRSMDRALLDGRDMVDGYVLPESWLSDRLRDRVRGFYLLDNGSLAVRIFRLLRRLPVIARPEGSGWWQDWIFRLLILGRSER